MENATISLNVTQQEAQTILAALGVQPFNSVYQLIFKLDGQIKAATASETSEAPSAPPQNP